MSGIDVTPISAVCSTDVAVPVKSKVCGRSSGVLCILASIQQILAIQRDDGSRMKLGQVVGVMLITVYHVGKFRRPIPGIGI
jgi:hypothetical protein